MAEDKQNSTDQKADATFPADGEQTPVAPGARRTGTDIASTETRDGAEPEAPGSRNEEIPGSPNQGTESR